MNAKLLLACAFLAVTPPTGWADFTCNPPRGPSAEVSVDHHKFFQIDFEEVDTIKNEVIDNQLTYDGSKEIIRLTKTQFDRGTTDIFFDFKNSQKLTFSLKDRTCQATKLVDSDPDFFLVGGRKASTINSPLSVFHLEGRFGSGGAEIVVEKRKQSFQIRGINIVQYRSCQSWQVSDSVNKEVEVSVEATDGDKLSFVKSDSVPMRMVVVGENFKKAYNYFHYRPKLDPSATNVPEGIFCENMKTSVEFPAAPQYVSYGQEIKQKDKVYNVQTTYDIQRQFELVNFFQFSKNDTIEYRDFGTGLRYTVDKKTLNCKVKDLMDLSGLNVEIDENGILHQRTFFGVGQDVTYNYMGQTYYNKQMADVWNANYKMGNDDGVLEWYFLVEDEHTETINDKTDEKKEHNYRLPLMRRFTPKGKPDDTTEVRLFDVEFAKPKYEMLDLEVCHRGNHMYVITFGVKATQEEQKSIKADINRFQWNTASSLAIKLGVDLFRVTGVVPTFMSNDRMSVDFVLLGPPPKSHHVKRNREPISLKEAVDNLKAKHQANQLTVVGPDMKEYAVTDYHIADVTSKSQAKHMKNARDNGYTPGAMAGLGIAMVVIGAGTGGFAAYRFVNF